MDNIAVYGFGNRGRDVTDQLIALGKNVSVIFDKEPSANAYRGIPIKTVEAWLSSNHIDGLQCIVALHNSYVNVKEVDGLLKSFGIKPISLVNVELLGLKLEIPQGYWLDKSSSEFRISEDDADWIESALKDNVSIKVFQGLKRYRETGEFTDLPEPSLADEYIPKDLPRYADPVKLVDCGAYDGLAYRKLASAYNIAQYLAFEPDMRNYNLLTRCKFNCPDVTLLPVAVGTRSELMRFKATNDMGSRVDESGDLFIQGVAVDDITNTFPANLVKLDVEGSESAALQGMLKLITRCMPTLCVSVYHRPEDLIQIPKMIDSWNLGYHMYLRTHEYNCFGTVIYAFPPTVISLNKGM